jgi:hypothetical protein
MARAADLETAPAGYWLAQANVAYALAPHDDPKLAGFMARLDELNALAEKSPGFVWRYVTDSRDPAQREFDDPLVVKAINEDGRMVGKIEFLAEVVRYSADEDFALSAAALLSSGHLCSRRQLRPLRALQGAGLRR